MDPVCSRRRLLQRAVAAAAVGQTVFGILGTRSEARGEDDAGDAEGVRSRRYLGTGLTALADAHRRSWARGHHGAAVLAAHYFAKENELDGQAQRALQAQVDAFVRFRRREFPSVDPGRGTADPTRIVEQLAGHVDELRSGGHDAIYGSLALRALRDAPEYATPRVVDGVCRLLANFVETVSVTQATKHDEIHPLPPYENAADVASVTLDALLRPWSHVEEVGAGVVVHWVTYADALITLEELGHVEVARKGHAAHQRYLNRPVAAPGGDEPDRAAIDWTSAAYWESDAPRRVQKSSWFFGHSFKLPYSLFRLLRHVDAKERRTACLRRASHLSIPFEDRATAPATR